MQEQQRPLHKNATVPLRTGPGATHPTLALPVHFAVEFGESYPCTSGPFCSRVWRASWAAQSPNFSRRTGARPSSSSVSVLWSLLCGQYGRGIIMGGEGNGTRCIATTRSRPLPTTLPSLQHVDIPTQELELVGSSRPTQELAVDPHKNSQ